MSVQRTPAWQRWVDAGRERVDIVIDSGSSASMLPVHVAPKHELLPGANKVYTSASKVKVQELGTNKLTLGLQDGTSLQSSWEVGEIHRPLASVSRMTAKGNTVIFAPEEKGGSWMIDAIGKKTKLHLRGGVYVLPAWVEPVKEGRPSRVSTPGFPGQGKSL